MNENAKRDFIIQLDDMIAYLKIVGNSVAEKLLEEAKKAVLNERKA